MRKTLIILITLSFASSVFAQSVIITDGETSPNTLLEINDEGTTGSITFPSGGTPTPTTDKLYNEGGTLKWDGNALGLAGSGGDGHSLDADDGSPVDAVYVDNSGKVGIGLTNPSRGFVLYDSGVDVSSLIQNSFTGSTSSDGLSFRVAGENASIVNKEWANLTIATGGASNGSITLEPDGDVGIGEPEPTDRLHVHGDVKIESASPYLKFIIEDIYKGYIGVWSDDNLNIFNRTTTGKLRLATNNTERLIIDENGKIGIGTDSPTAKLQISSGNVRLDNTYAIRFNSENGQYSEIRTPGNNVWFSNYAAGAIRFNTGESAGTASARMIIKNDGNVGIGTSTPTSKLSIVGLSNYADNADAIANGLSVGDLYRTGDILKIVH